MSDQAKSVARPWRRFLRFSVRGMIVVVLVFGGGFGWIVRSARIQREAVAAITRAGGSVMYNFEDRSRNRVKPWAPQWIVDLIGIDYFGHVTYVMHSPFSTANDEEMAHVGRLTRLEHLKLDYSGVTDTGLAHLKGLTNLSELGLVETRD